MVVDVVHVAMVHNASFPGLDTGVCRTEAAWQEWKFH